MKNCGQILSACSAVGWLTGWTVYAVCEVGKVLPETTATWSLPLEIFIASVIPMWLGYDIGRHFTAQRETK